MVELNADDLAYIDRRRRELEADPNEPGPTEEQARVLRANFGELRPARPSKIAA